MSTTRNKEEPAMTPFVHIKNYNARMRAIAARYAYWMRRDCGFTLAR
jgi:hypothetical protein